MSCKDVMPASSVGSRKARACSRSVASRSHVLARLANSSLACGDAEVWASRTHVRACRRHSWGAPGMGGTPLANPFPTETRGLIPKRVFSVNAAVVHCKKKPEPGRSLGRASRLCRWMAGYPIGSDSTRDRIGCSLKRLAGALLHRGHSFVRPSAPW